MPAVADPYRTVRATRRFRTVVPGTSAGTHPPPWARPRGCKGGTGRRRRDGGRSGGRSPGHGFEPHYELHLWPYRDNPTGMFAEFNPAVSCANHQAHAHPAG